MRAIEIPQLPRIPQLAEVSPHPEPTVLNPTVSEATPSVTTGDIRRAPREAMALADRPTPVAAAATAVPTAGQVVPTAGRFGDPNGDVPARRRELAAFLRARRDRMTPEAVGLVSGRRRRAPGLRREEVAQLAGVGVTWYTWLEQGRPINASSDVLEAIARTLRLDATERDHMFRLADVSVAAGPPARSCLQPEVQVVLDGLEPYPASVINTRYDLLAWNRSYDAIFPRITRAIGDERNILWQIFTVQPCPIANREHELPRLVATFRAAYARHLSEPLWTELVERLSAASPQFAELWARHEVAEPRNRLKHCRLENGVELLLYSTIFNVTETPDARMAVYTPANEAAASYIDGLRTRAARE